MSKGNIICPVCGGRMKIVDTLTYDGKPDDWERLRLYECAECGYRVKTSETVITEGVEYSTLRTEGKSIIMDAGA